MFDRMDDCFLRRNCVLCHRFGREGRKKTRAIRIKQSGWEEEEGARKGRNIHRATTFWRREKITPKREREKVLFTFSKVLSTTSFLKGSVKKRG